MQKQTEKFGKWTVSENGDMKYDSGTWGYFISIKGLKEDNWLLHISEKKWIDWNEFMPAYFKALENAGIQLKQERFFY